MLRKLTYPVISALFLTLALAGCQREPVPADGDVIRFSVNSVDVAQAPTKTDPPIPTPETIGSPDNPLSVNGCKVIVWGSLTEDSENWKPVFDNHPSIEIENENNTWTYDEDTYGKKYWNREASYKFRAAYPIAAVDGSSDVNSLTATYQGNAQDLMIASTTLAGEGAKTVELKFMHTCSAVRVYMVDVRGAQTSARYKITNFGLQNLYMDGTLTVNWNTVAVNWNTSGSTRTDGYSWTPSTGSTGWDVPATYTAFTDWLFFIPQALNPDTEKPCINLTFTAGNQTISYIKNLEDLNTTSWEAGMMYTYFIIVRPKEIEMTVEWTEWGENVNTEYTPIG